MSFNLKTFVFPSLFTAAAALQIYSAPAAYAALTPIFPAGADVQNVCHLLKPGEKPSSQNSCCTVGSLNSSALRQLRQGDDFDQLLAFAVNNCPEFAAILMSGATGTVTAKPEKDQDHKGGRYTKPDDGDDTGGGDTGGGDTGGGDTGGGDTGGGDTGGGDTGGGDTGGGDTGGGENHGHHGHGHHGHGHHGKGDEKNTK